MMIAEDFYSAHILALVFFFYLVKSVVSPEEVKRKKKKSMHSAYVRATKMAGALCHGHVHRRKALWSNH